MASLGDVGDALRRVLDTIDQSIAAHHHAADLAEQARDLLAVAGSGTLQADVEQACALFTRVIEGITEPEGQLSTLATAAESIRSYLRGHGISHETGGASTPAPAPAQPPARQAASSEPPMLTAKRLAAIRRELPPPITEANSGRKTHGRWIGPDGVARTIMSGKDADSRLVDDQLERQDMPGRAARAGDVEMKLAAHMAEHGISHATVIINYQPCKGRFGCDTLVPILLPEGATLTVHGVTPDGTSFRKRYTGGARPWWR